MGKQLYRIRSRNRRLHERFEQATARYEYMRTEWEDLEPFFRRLLADEVKIKFPDAAERVRFTEALEGILRGAPASLLLARYEIEDRRTDLMLSDLELEEVEAALSESALR